MRHYTTVIAIAVVGFKIIKTITAKDITSITAKDITSLI